MSMLERIDLFRESLPRNCLYCEWGHPVVFGRERFLDTFACGAHSARGLRSKMLTAPPFRYAGCRGDYRCYSPMMAWDESCGLFSPVRLESRKAGMLDLMGLFDGTPYKGRCGEEGG